MPRPGTTAGIQDGLDIASIGLLALAAEGDEIILIGLVVCTGSPAWGSFAKA
jgi:hypothetical protein